MSSTKTPNSLRNRIISAGSWVLGGHIVSQVLRLGGNLIMTRLLVPEMFGVMAVANVFLVGLALFSDLGLRQNIIQSKHGNEPVFLNTVWTVQIIRGGVIWLLAFGLAIAIQLLNNAQLWASYSVYAEPVLPYVIGVISFNAVINGFESTKLATANRNLSLGVITRIELVSQSVGLMSMIVWALIDRSIWALVIGSLIGSILKVILSHAWIPGIKNKLHWDRDAFKHIFQFGKWVFLTSIIGFLAMNGDRILLGGLVETRVLGIYVIAFFLVDAFQLVLNKIIYLVIYPALSEVVRDSRKDLRIIYYRIRLPLDVIALIGAGFIFSCGSLIIQVLYDDRYMAAGHMMEVLSVALIGVRYNVVGNIFLAMGKPQLQVPIILARLLPLYILLPISFSWFGLDGALWVAGGSMLFSLPVIFYLKIKYDILNITREIQVLPLLIAGYVLGSLTKYIYAIL